jgi:hypothetical protein
MGSDDLHKKRQERNANSIKRKKVKRQSYEMGVNRL